MKTKSINIAKDFSPEASGRFPRHGKYNGETFREELLVPALREYDQVIVDLNGIDPDTSFLEESFGGLVRLKNFTKSELDKKLKLIANPAMDDLLVRKFIQEAKPGKNNKN